MSSEYFVYTSSWLYIIAASESLFEENYEMAGLDYMGENDSGRDKNGRIIVPPPLTTSLRLSKRMTV